MNYYVKPSIAGEVEGPLTFEEIKTRLTDGTIGTNWFATSDIGESRKHVLKLPARDWWPVSEVPGISNPEDVGATHESVKRVSVNYTVPLLVIFHGIAGLIIKMTGIIDIGPVYYTGKSTAVSDALWRAGYSSTFAERYDPTNSLLGQCSLGLIVLGFILAAFVTPKYLHDDSARDEGSIHSQNPQGENEPQKRNKEDIY